MTGCCTEPDCRRTKPMMLMRSGLTQRWYFVTDYTDKGEGRFIAKHKHACPPGLVDQLTAAMDALSEVGPLRAALDEIRSMCAGVMGPPTPVIEEIIERALKPAAEAR